MLKVKALISMSIFIVMFSLALVLNHYNQPSIYLHEVHDANGIQILGEVEPLYREPFKPREYIKIR